MHVVGGRGDSAIVLTGRGVEQHSNGVDTASAFINLALALGLPGRSGSGYGCVTGQGNGQGGREHGQKADQLPGYRRIDDPVAREHADDADEGDGEGDAEVVSYAEPSRGTYKKLVIRDGRLVGAIMVGEVDTVGTVTQLFDRGGRLPPDRLPLLFGRMGAEPAAGDPAHIPDRATVCECNGVSKGTITQAWQEGSRSLAEVATCTKAGTGCGSCRDTIEGIVTWLERSDPVAH